MKEEVKAFVASTDDAASPVGYRADCVRQHHRDTESPGHDVRRGGFLDGDRFYLRALACERSL